MIHISTGLWMDSSTVHPPIHHRFRGFTTPTWTRFGGKQNSTGVSTLVDNSTVVIYEKPCEPVENHENMGSRRAPAGYLALTCTGLSTACGGCGQLFRLICGSRYGWSHGIQPQFSTAIDPHSSTNYTVDTHLSVDESRSRPRPLERIILRFNDRIGGRSPS